MLRLKTGNYYACFNPKANICLTFAFPTNLSLSQPMSFLAFPSSSLPSSAGGEVIEWLCGAWLLAGVKPQHKFTFLSSVFVTLHTWSGALLPILLTNSSHTEVMLLLKTFIFRWHFKRHMGEDSKKRRGP